MFGGDKTCISELFVKHCEQANHHPEMQHHLEKVEAIEVLDCTWRRILILPHFPEHCQHHHYHNNINSGEQNNPPLPQETDGKQSCPYGYQKHLEH